MSKFTDKERFRALSILNKHIGKQNALAMPVFYEQVFGERPATAISGTRRLRALVTDLRSCGEPICSSTGGGYYLASAGSELEDYCKRMQNQALRKLLIVSRIKKISIQALYNQMELELDADLTAVGQQ